jgi:hypothetical protein
MINQILPLIAEYAISLTSLSIGQLYYERNSHKLDFRAATIAAAMTAIIRRVHKLELDHRFRVEIGGLVPMFESTYYIDLQLLTIRTYDEDPDMIAKILKGCRNVYELNLSGRANISQVMIKISKTCCLLETLFLHHRRQVDGTAMKSLLRCCPKLFDMGLDASLNVEAYESLALYGSNLLNLTLDDARAELASVSSYPPSSFPSNSLVFDPSFKQRRNQPINSLITGNQLNLSIKSLVAFLSCFGTIKRLETTLPYSFSPTSINDAELYDVPIFHVHELHLQYPPQSVNQSVKMFSISNRTYDHIFSAFMDSCRSIKELYLDRHRSASDSVATLSDPNPCDQLQASSLITIASIYHRRRQPLSFISYPRKLNLNELKALLPYIRLEPW